MNPIVVIDAKRKLYTHYIFSTKPRIRVAYQADTLLDADDIEELRNTPLKTLPKLVA